jgi:hypothetical protein
MAQTRVVSLLGPRAAARLLRVTKRKVPRMDDEVDRRTGLHVQIVMVTEY